MTVQKTSLRILQSRPQRPGGGLKGSLGSWLSKVVRNCDELEFWKLKIKLREQIRNSWRIQGETVIREALKSGGKTLIVIDELPILLHKLITTDGEKGKRACRTCWIGFGTSDKLPSSSSGSGNLSAAPSGFHGSRR